MKQFSLQEYFAHPELKVVTRDRRPARITCTNRAGFNTKPIVALITLCNGDEVIKSYWEDGIETRGGKENRYDLFFTPTKHTDYINLYHNHLGYFLGGGEYRTEEEAKRVIAGDKFYITTIKAEWEE